MKCGDIDAIANPAAMASAAGAPARASANIEARAGNPFCCPHCGGELDDGQLGGMTKRQRDVLVFIVRYAGLHGYSPTYEEIAAGVGLSSKGNVAALVERLTGRGLLSRSANWRARNIVVTPLGQRAAA